MVEDNSNLIIPTLMYHGVNLESSDYLTISEKTFFEHIKFITNEYNPIRIKDVINYLNNNCILPKNPILITFDDSLQEVIEYACPILKDFSCNALFFVIGQYIGKTNDWNHKWHVIQPHMTKKDLKYLLNLNHEIGSHTLTHQRLSKLPDDRLQKEFEKNNQILQEIIGSPPESISYPYGDASSKVLEICGKFHKIGFTTVRQGVFNWKENLLNIRRIYVSPNDSPLDLKKKIENYINGVQHE
ncbi:polysaccharide deacetylase family protein [Candidatus Harpocratesius sp.]